MAESENTCPCLWRPWPEAEMCDRQLSQLYKVTVTLNPVSAMSIKRSISFSPAPHCANSFRIGASPRDGGSAAMILRGAAPVHFKKCGGMLQSTFDISSPTDPNVMPQKNGFVDTVIRCYNEHGALVIR